MRGSLLSTFRADLVKASCSDLFFECIGKNVPIEFVKPFWRYKEAQSLKKQISGDMNNSTNSYPIVNIGQSSSLKSLGKCIPNRQIDSKESADVNKALEKATEYARTVICPAKFGVGTYEVCSVPSQLCNKVYAKIEGKYALMVEPTDPAGISVLKKAYLDTATSALRRLMPGQLTKLLSDIYGKYTENKGPQSVDDFMKKFGFSPSGDTWVANTSEIEVKAEAFAINPTDWLNKRGEYKNFQEFFIRELKKDARPIAGPNNSRIIVAPADSKLTVIQNIKDKITVFSVKQEDFTLSNFLGDSSLAAEFGGGTMMIFRLSPYNYHRYHFAVDAVPLEGSFIKKDGLESVDPIAYKTEIHPLIINKRMLVKLDTPYGIIPMIIVGAYNVGTINNTYSPCASYKKGDQLGYFKFGGSTVVLLFKKGQIVPVENFVKHSLQGFETAVKLGEEVATFTKNLTLEEEKSWENTSKTSCKLHKK